MTNKNTALITGASQRIGKEMAICLAKKGFDLVIHYNKSQAQATQLLQELKQHYNINGAIIDGDLSDKSSTKKIANFMFKNYPNWNLLINNSSIFNKSNFLDDLDEEFENNNLDKFVYLERSYKMICNFNKKFKKWVPIKVYK
jgi:short-subunit dehydrogenase